MRGASDLSLLEQQGRDERYFLTFTQPGSPEVQQQQQQSGSGTGSQPGSGGGGQQRPGAAWQRLRPPALPWHGAAHAGSVRVCLRQDAVEEDIVQAVLQAAYLRQALGIPPAGTKHPLLLPEPSSAAAPTDVRRAVADSCRRARADLKPFIAQLREGGWQLAPFMLSSTEKRRYLQL